MKLVTAVLFALGCFWALASRAEQGRDLRPTQEYPSSQMPHEIDGAPLPRPEVLFYLKQVHNSELIFEINRRLSLANSRWGGSTPPERSTPDVGRRSSNVAIDASCVSKSKYIGDTAFRFSSMTVTLTNMTTGDTIEQLFADAYDSTKCEEIAKSITDKLRGRRLLKNVVVAGCADGAKLVKVFLNLETAPISFKKLSTVDMSVASSCSNEALKWNNQIVAE